MAFFPSGADAAEEDPQVPTADFDQYALVPVETGDLSSELVLPAMVQPDAGTGLKATAEGEINKIWLSNGDQVEKGQRILQVRQPVEPEIPAMPLSEEEVVDGEEGEQTQQAAPPQPSAQEYRYVNLVATTTGTL